MYFVTKLMFSATTVRKSVVNRMFSVTTVQRIVNTNIHLVKQYKGTSQSESI